MQKQKHSLASKLLLGLTVLFFYLPIIYIVVFSFNDSRSLTHFSGFSLQWYEKMFSDRTMMEAVGYTIFVAVVATIVSTIVGTLAAIGLSRSRKLLRNVVEQVNNLPVMNPEIVTAIGLLMFFSSLGVNKGLTTMLLAHIMFCTPYVILSVTPKLRSLDPNLADAALDLGATPLQALTKVIVPQIMPGILSGVILGVGRIVGETAALIYTAGSVTGVPDSLMSSGRTLAVHMYALLSEGLYTDEAYATAVVLLVLVFIINRLSAYVANKIQNR